MEELSTAGQVFQGNVQVYSLIQILEREEQDLVGEDGKGRVQVRA